MDIVAIDHLKKYYGPARGVEDVSFSLKQGEILGFIGPNGAGKSTVIRVLMNLLNITSGSVTVFGEQPSHRNNRRIGYLPSEVNLYSEMTVYDQLKYFASIRGVKEEAFLELAETLDLDLQKKIADLSLGNKKKVGIVASLMHEPELLILDEPTSGLDPLVQQTFLSLLVKAKNRGASILLSSHVLAEVEKVCDRVVLIKEGRILFSDTIEAIKSSSYKKVKVTPRVKLELEGLKLLKTEGNREEYSFKGDINQLTKALSSCDLMELAIFDLTLDEIFMHYFHKENGHD